MAQPSSDTNLLTCVSCYFPVKNKFKEGAYNDWFTNTLSINCPYIFFTPKSHVAIIKEYRKDLPTYFIECEIEDFTMYKYKDRMITDPYHCPSVELNLIWNEKIFMMKKASELNPYNTDWFHWIDAGICTYRNKSPPKQNFATREKFALLPRNKFIYSQSEPYSSERTTNTNHYHHISGTYLIHKNFIPAYAALFESYADKLIDTNNIWTDQVIHTHIYKNDPSFFFKLNNGYGTISTHLFSETI